jgi:polar amino acid transport system substrate-binding protein
MTRVVFFLLVMLNFCSSNLAENESLECIKLQNRNFITAGMQKWKPYQYVIFENNKKSKVGMDIDLAKIIATEANLEIQNKFLPFKVQLKHLEDGTLDMIYGATYNQSRNEYAYFSKPYRFEENAIFVLNNVTKNIDYKDLNEVLTQVRLQNFRLGVTKGYVYADDRINDFINDSENVDIIINYDNDARGIEDLVRGNVDGFITDRVVGGHVALELQVDDKLSEINLNAKTPIHFMFSKKSVSANVLKTFNNAIVKISKTNTYRKQIRKYIYPTLLLQTISSSWFYVIGLVGAIAFAISGIVISFEQNRTIFGAILLAMIPGTSGGIIRDIIIQREQNELLLNPTYIYYILITVILSFALIRFLAFYNKRAFEKRVISKYSKYLRSTFDAIGQSAFVITGVCITVVYQIDPVILWGAFFAFITSASGIILRDLMSRRPTECLQGHLNAEISIFWGLVFTIILEQASYDPNLDKIKYMAILVMIGHLLTSIYCVHHGVQNLYFYHIKNIQKS